MSNRFTQKYRHLAQLYRDRGLTQVLGHVARVILAVLYARQVVYIILARIDQPERAAVSADTEPGALNCLVVASPATLDAIAQDFPTTLRDSVDILKTRVAQGCVVFVARHRRPEGTGTEITGYSISERGVFSALGRRGPIADDIFFGHYIEVLPRYRGQRIADVLNHARAAYCRAQGMTWLCGTVAPANAASLRATSRYGYRIVGTVQRLSLLGGLIVWETPWEEIEKALWVLDDAERPAGGA